MFLWWYSNHTQNFSSFYCQKLPSSNILKVIPFQTLVTLGSSYSKTCIVTNCIITFDSFGLKHICKLHVVLHNLLYSHIYINVNIFLGISSVTARFQRDLEHENVELSREVLKKILYIFFFSLSNEFSTSLPNRIFLLQQSFQNSR